MTEIFLNIMSLKLSGRQKKQKAKPKPNQIPLPVFAHSCGSQKPFNSYQTCTEPRDKCCSFCIFSVVFILSWIYTQISKFTIYMGALEYFNFPNHFPQFLPRFQIVCCLNCFASVICNLFIFLVIFSSSATFPTRVPSLFAVWTAGF